VCFLQGGTPPYVFMPSQERLRELLDYDPITGNLYRKNAKCRCTPIGYIHSDRTHLECGIENKKFLLHRVVWTMLNGPIPDGLLIDHIDQNGFNNRIENLRLADKQINGRNAHRSKANTSGATGVVWYTRKSKWAARITIDYRAKHLGYFDSLEEAKTAYENAKAAAGFHPNHGNKIASTNVEASFS
jgi:HNH endonuclease